MLSSTTPRLQTKLKVNQPGDPYEEEADQVADQVMQIPGSVQSDARQQSPSGVPNLQRKRAGRAPSNVDRQQPSLPEPTKIQRTESTETASGPTEAPPIVHQVLSSPGQPLDGPTRDFMEPRFGHDFSDVRVHTGSEAAESARAVGAIAYTAGNNIVFDSDYSPGTTAGLRLSAHELTHVVQQRATPGTALQRAPAKQDYKKGGEGWAGLVQATVEELDKHESHSFKIYPPVFGDGDVEALEKFLDIADQKGWLQPWALSLQARPGPHGNYLFHLYGRLSEEKSAKAKILNDLAVSQGIQIGITSGHFQSLNYLDPAVKAPLNPAVAKATWSQGVDRFVSATYDVSYKPARQGNISELLRLTYEDGISIDISLWDISDNLDASWENAISQAYIGPGGRVFPSRLSRNSTPRLWHEKQIAVAKMQGYNEDWIFFLNLALAGVMSNLPIGPVVGPHAPAEPSVPPARGGRSSAPSATGAHSSPEIPAVDSAPAPPATLAQEQKPAIVPGSSTDKTVVDAANDMANKTGHRLTTLEKGNLKGVQEVSVVAHGNETIVEVGGKQISPRQLAKNLKASGFQGGTVRLVACRTAGCVQGGRSFAQQLSAELSNLGIDNAVIGSSNPVSVPTLKSSQGLPRVITGSDPNVKALPPGKGWEIFVE